MYFFKKLVGALVEPLTFSLVLALIAGVLWMLRRRRMSGALLIAAGAIAYLASTPFIASALLRPLTSGYVSPLDHPPRVSYIVVLGSWYAPRADLPITASMTLEGVARLTEGVRLLRLLPGARLVVSGGIVAPSTIEAASARGYERMARALGVGADSIIVLDKARDTAGEARSLVSVVGAEPFLLVTSADHIRRSMRLMERAGLRPIPAMATRWGGDEFAWRQLIPDAGGLSGTEAALHEYLGLAAISLGLD